MDHSVKSQYIEQFQLAFSQVCADQIEQVIQECRSEALAQARQILRDRSLNDVVERVIETLPLETESDGIVGTRVKTGYRKAQPQLAQKKDVASDSASLNDRILAEIEAIREQIARNEELLSQIKPFVQAVSISKE